MILDFADNTGNVKERIERLISQGKCIGEVMKEGYISKEQREEIFDYYRLAQDISRYQLQMRWSKIE